jgi:hypothetical protein
MLAVAAVLVSGACNSATEPTSAISVRVESEIFVRRGNVAIVPYIVSNDGAAPVRLVASCGEDPAAVVERRSGSRWEAYAGGACLGIFNVGMLVLPPGSTHGAAVSLTEPGEYRLRVPSEQHIAVSSGFEVR